VVVANTGQEIKPRTSAGSLPFVEGESVADDLDDERERRSLVRALRQHLESLARAGLDRVPARSLQFATQLSEQPAWQPAVATVPGANLTDESHARAGAHEASDPRRQPPLVSPSLVVSPPTSLDGQSATSVLPAPSLAVLFNSSHFDTPPVPVCDRPLQLSTLAAEVAVCRRCPHLADTRTQTVFGVGNPETRLMFIGEAPGFDEDRTGEPFVGRAGQLLTDMITKGMGLTREQVYIANILKCRPPENRNPLPDESNNCFGYLERQIEIIRPEFLCLLGKVAAQAILNTTQSIGKLRGKWHRYRGVAAIATYHPSYLLRTPSAKKDAWEDLQVLMKEMGLNVPPKK
jgi:uracil-DNA glycosylase family 4